MTDATTIARAYDDWAASYDSDRNRTRDLDQIVTRRLLEDFRCKSILEIGCGTGKNTGFFAQIGEHVRALDFSAAMIAQARNNIRARNVDFITADITKPWPGAGESAELVSCNLVLEHVKELPPIFCEAARTLTGGGTLFVSELHPFRQYHGTVATFKRNDEPVKIPAFVHHVSDFLKAADDAGLSLVSLHEWWHDEDEGKPPRLITFLFSKQTGAS